MSEFYNYISKILLNYLSAIQLTRGDRYSLQLDLDEEVNNLYNSFKHIAETNGNKIEEFRVSNNYETYCVEVNKVKLVVAKTDKKIKPDFLTYLRNNVDKKDTEFENTALLFIHNSNLDSIIGGSKRLESEGMPLHIKSIEKNIYDSIKNSNLPMSDKRILIISLDRSKEDVHEESTSIFDYKSVFNILEQKYIKPNQFKEFGMFIDDKINTFLNTSKEQTLDKRIIDNMDIFKIVDSIHKYSDISELEQHFDSNGAEKLESEEWAEIDFDKVKRSKDNYDKQKKPNYLEDELKIDNALYTIWDRTEGDSAAKKRKRNIIVFNPKKNDQVEIALKFNAKVIIDEVKSTSKKATFRSNNNRIIVTISDTNIETQATKLSYYNLNFNIIVINLKEEFLDAIKNKYLVTTNMSINYKKIILINDENELCLNAEGILTEELILTQENNKLSVTDDHMIKIINDSESTEDLEKINLDIEVNGVNVPLMIKNESIRPTKITPYQLWSGKFVKNENFIYERKIDKKTNKESINISQNTRSYYPVGEFRKYLEYEEFIMSTNAIHFKIINGEIIEENLVLPNQLESKLVELFEFYKMSHTLPSLIYFSKEYITVAQEYVNSYFDYIDQIDEKFDGDKELLKAVFDIGVIYEYSSEDKIHFAPWHPMNIAYQLQVYNKLDINDFENNLSGYINNTFLVPYINSKNNELYKPIDQEIVEWTTYVKQNNTKYNSSNKYVPRIVSNKIRDFITHFEYLFLNEYAPLKVGVVNLGDCEEILKGLFEFYTSELRHKKIEDLRPIELHIYDNDNNINAFEELSSYSNIEEIKEQFGIRLQVKPYDEQDILNIYRNKVHFYKFKLHEVNYNHVTFYKMNDYGSIGYNHMYNIETGLSLDGLVTDVSSTYVGGAYVTGFGSKNLDLSKDDFVNCVVKFNSFTEFVNKLSAYDKDTIIATSIKEEENELLKRIYDKSYWITFIDPKVDLNYFKGNSKAKELMIIHYSDQYSNSSGYDAITVTQKSKMYMKVIEEFLENESDFENIVENNIEEIINSFNVFNGEWLLRLVSRQLMKTRDQFAREKLSLFSAVKLFIADSLDTDIFWIPISSEELVRVSGGSGLSKKDSIFSPSASGVFSDDILMIGIRFVKNVIQVAYYPIEVKIGNNLSEVSKTAKEQVIKAAKHFKVDMFNNNLEGFYAKLLKNQLMQIAITQVKKIQMYGMWNDKDWTRLLDSQVVKKLMNDDYELVNQFESITKDCGIITFTRNHTMRSKNIVDKDGYTIDYYEYPMHDAFSYLAMGLDEICVFNDWEVHNTSALVENIDIEERTESKIDKNELLADEVINESFILGDPTETASLPINVKYDLDPHNIAQSIEKNSLKKESEMKIHFGINQLTKEDVVWLPNSTDKVMHTNTGIIGTMGTGKTQFTKSLIAQIKKQEVNNVDSQEIGILIFDYKGDYIKEDFVNATEAKVYNLYNLPFNPLSIYEGIEFKPMLPLHTANELRDTIAKAYNLGAVQKNTLSEVLEASYASAGIIPYDRDTWKKESPTIDSVFRQYMLAEYPTNDSLYAALNELNKFRIFESDNKKTKPLFELVKGVMVINLAGYSESIQNLVVAITLDTFYAQMQAKGHSKIDGNYRQLSKMILVDEADNFLSKNFNSVRKILKEGREFGIGTILSTQFLKHFSTSDNEFSQYILTWVIHKVNEISNKEVGNIFSMTNKNDQESWVNNIKNLEKHYSIVNLGGDNLPRHVRDKAFWELMKEDYNK